MPLTKYVKTKYRNDGSITFLMSLGKRRFLRRKDQLHALDVADELEVCRDRINRMAHELNEWRWKVGGSSATYSGRDWEEMVNTGLWNKIGKHPIPICDDDLKPPLLHP